MSGKLAKYLKHSSRSKTTIMRITNEIHTAIIVANRFEQNRQLADFAENAVRRFIMADNLIITDDQRKTLKAAAAILDDVRERMTTNDVEKYLRDHLPVQAEMTAG